jgi:hypothetical protein
MFKISENQTVIQQLAHNPHTHPRPYLSSRAGLQIAAAMRHPAQQSSKLTCVHAILTDPFSALGPQRRQQRRNLIHPAPLLQSALLHHQGQMMMCGQNLQRQQRAAETL